jgi:hypothetical protein
MALSPIERLLLKIKAWAVQGSTFWVEKPLSISN